MIIDIKIEINDKTCTEEALAKAGYTKESLSDKYNNEILKKLQKFAADHDVDPSTYVIYIMSNIYNDEKPNPKRGLNGMISRDEYIRLKSAMNIIKDMIAEPIGGQIIDGIDYVDLYMMESKTLCLDALNLLTDFVIKYGIDINDLEEG